MAEPRRFSLSSDYLAHLAASGGATDGPPRLKEPHLPVRVIIEEARPDQHILTADNSLVPLAGQTLRSLRAEVGGDTGHLTDPMTGRAVPVSLEKWKGRDPDSTRLVVAFRTQSRLADD